jgi:hypothetical protein
MLLAMSETVSVAETAIDTGVPLPIVKLSVPPPTAAPVGKAAEAVALALARVCTSTLNDVGNVPPIAVALTDALSEEVTLTEFHPVTLESFPTASESVETKDLI